MTETKNRPLRVFLCHASDDKPAVRDLYRQLCAEGWLDVWLDEEKLLPGQEWDLEIEKAVEEADVVLVSLSTHSVDKEGYIQKELRFVLNIADQKPEGAIFIVPIRLNDCPTPRRLRMWQYVDYFPKDRRKWAYERILQSLRLRAARLGLSVTNPAEEKTRLEAEERARKEAEAKAKKDKEEHDRKAVEEPKRKLVERRTWLAREARERKAAEEQARKDAERPQPEKVVVQPFERELSPSLSSHPSSQPVKKPAHKIKLVPFGIAAIVLLVLTGGIFGINYIIKNWPTVGVSTSTITPTIASTATFTATPTHIPTSTFTPKPPTATPTPRFGIGSTQVSEKDGMVMVYVPASEFTMGNDADVALAECQKYRSDCDRNWFVDEEPPHTVYLDAFWIDRTEVTNKMYALCVAAGQCDPPGSSASYTHPNYYGNSQYDDYPVVYVSWDDASAYCAWRGDGTRLPTEAEWEKAARGTDERTYPWGNTSPNSSLLNYNSIVGDTTAVGNYPSGASPYGAYDMAGNVWEWVYDWYQSGYYATLGDNASNPQGPSSGDGRVLRGGAWGNLDGNVRSANRSGYYPSNSYYYIGFRCSRLLPEFAT
ncbi:MAG: SUMF1/EgtB/PvdO family nonheme iron enzyme [Anaerolineales bacterium]|nr:SUMF1/EgtB/PvdO family nonheme iron enzyme [Anaerolineales bacterium]